MAFILLFDGRNVPRSFTNVSAALVPEWLRSAVCQAATQFRNHNFGFSVQLLVDIGHNIEFEFGVICGVIRWLIYFVLLRRPAC